MLNHPSFYPNHLADIGVPSSGINFHYAILSSFATGRRSFQSSVGTFRRDKSVRKAAGAIHQNPSTLFRYLCLAVHMITSRHTKEIQKITLRILETRER